MAKPKVLRNAKAHEVKMQAGSKVAQSRPAPKVGPREDPPPKASAQQGPAISTTVRPVTRITPRPTKPKTPGHARLLPEGPGKLAAPLPQTSAPEAKQLWASDESVLQRLSDLRLRNAQLAEQLDRLEAANKP